MSKSDFPQVIFKLDPEKIPAFFEADTAAMIFNLGSDINLLKMNKQLDHGTIVLPDYYKICAAPPENDLQQSICQRL